MPEVTIVHDIGQLQQIIGRLQTDVIKRVLTEAAKVGEREIMARFQRTVETWEHKPVFEAIREVRGDEVTLLVGTDDPVYGYVDAGTRPHRIEPRGNYPLRFQWGGPGSYRPKTMPGQLASTQGGPTGPMVAFWSVNHPGTQPRRFTEQIHREVGPIMLKKVVDLIRIEMDRAIRMR